jgi:phosphohistidine phosphatase
MPVLYLVRHAIAAERGPKYPKDDTRPLTRVGKARMKEVVAGWRKLKPRLDLILTSPLVRAQSTAEILRDGLREDLPLERFPALAPGHRPSEVAAALEKFAKLTKSGKGKKVSVMALVGHEPDLGQLAAWLIGAKEPIPFKKGGIARIDVIEVPPKQNGQLIWHATPKLLRALA